MRRDAVRSAFRRGSRFDIVLGMSPRRRRTAGESPALPESSGAVTHAAVSLRQQVSAALQRAILTGVYVPGQRLIERELVERFGVSSIPVREALQEMESLGLVVKRPNAGCSVINLTRAEIAQISSLRILIEPAVARWAVERGSDEAAARLAAPVQGMELAAAQDDVTSFFSADRDFHNALWDMAGNPWAARALETALGSLFAVGLRVAIAKGILSMKKEADKHRVLFNLVMKRKGDAAAKQMHDIALRFETVILPFVDE